MTADAWTLTVAALLGEPWPALPDLPGRRHACPDRGLTDDEMAGIESPTELALIAGISRQAAFLRIKKARAALLDSEESLD